MCELCSKLQVNPDQWVAAVQLRQHVSHRRTFFYLEQLILKHDAANRAIKIQQLNQGIDFFFGHRSHALKFVDFVSRVVLVRTRNDKQLVSHDHKSNTVSYKYTFSVEISPVCREDLICLPPKVAASLGNIGPLLICTKYWRASFKTLLSSRQLVECVVLDVDVVSEEVNIGGSKYVIARVSDFGKNDTIFSVRTHLGHLLESGRRLCPRL
ncbi:hypothetical protein CQW23_30108 [Capsicum baccatum]|uniref:60S ribosomal export protein NMD3 n=1 Tax=Capsicum baccatum TaxID=33114 RepID=A0A2G2VBM5_CAPBA|nr:hypothetical protein CQW23_30108 [Capsicum baccatum]